MVIQVILSFFLVFALSRVLLQLRKGNLTIRSFIFWITVFFAALIGIVNPQLTSKIAHFLGIGRGADVVTYLSIALLFYLVFRISVSIEDLRHEITEVVRKISLSQPKKARKKRL